MTKIINLRQARKQKERTSRRAIADANAAKFGESKPLQNARLSESDRAARLLDAHKQEDEADD